MSTRSIGLTEPLHDYLLSTFVREHALLARLREETAALTHAGMQISPEQGSFMRWLVRLLGAKRCLEVGVFTGYSSLSVALELPAGGSIVACDVSEEWTSVARRYFAEARLSEKFDLRIGPALPTLSALIDGGASGSFDFAFIDADKENYLGYYESCLELLRAGGVLAVDNTLWGGKVADSEASDDSTRAIRALNRHAAQDPRVNVCLIPIGDGLLLAQKLG